MRIRRTEQLPYYDLTVPLAVAPALHDMWASLRFDPYLRNPERDEPVEAFELASGRHRQAGAVYRWHSVRTVVEEAERDTAIFDAELNRLKKSEPSREAMREFHERRQANRLENGVTVEVPHVVEVLLLRDNLNTIAGRLGHDDDAWQVDVETRVSETPSVSVVGDARLSEFAARQGLKPGCLARWVGGKADGTIEVHSGSLFSGGTVVEGRGRANRFRAEVLLTADRTDGGWLADLDLRIRAKGLGRLVLLVFGGRLRRHIESSIDQAVAALHEHHDLGSRRLDAMSTFVDANGGIRRMLDDRLWDDPDDAELIIPPEIENDPQMMEWLGLDELDADGAD